MLSVACLAHGHEGKSHFCLVHAGILKNDVPLACPQRVDSDDPCDFLFIRWAPNLQ